MARSNIPKIIHQIWLGPNPRPVAWMDTWKHKHPDWQYQLWTDSHLPKLHNQKQFDLINSYPGKADILRLEVLFQYGGIYIDADSECLQPLDPLLRYHFFACYENEVTRPGLIANGVMGSEPLHALLYANMNEVKKISNINANKAWIITGPLLFTKVIHEYEVFNKPIKKLPSHNFFPEHYSGYQYAGKGKIYAREHWQSTKIELNLAG